MTCSGCAHENPAGAKFCEECGTPLAIACANCGTELRANVKFCSECGTPVAASGASGAGGALPGAGSPRSPLVAPAIPSASTRKIVTIVFADLAGSTAMQERLDPESVRRFMESYYDAMRDAVESHGGTLTQFLGDGVKAVFGIPRVAEDDAIRAVRAGVAMQESFRALAENQRGAVGKVGLRVAVNTGEVVANADDEIIGDPVNVAARLQEQGGNGDVVVGDSTARLVGALVTLAPLGSFALKGRAEVVAAFLVESLEPPASAATAAFVGRDEEIVRLTLVYETAVEKPATALAVLLGSPGLGKSRLIEEFARRLGETANLVEVHCEQANSATFAPLAVTLRALLGIEAGTSGDALKDAVLAAIPGDGLDPQRDQERTRIAGGIAALLAGSPGSIEESFFVVRRLFATLASERPVVLVIDDLQWAEPLLLDLVEHLVQWGSGVPMLVLVGARPELRDKRVSLTIPGGLVSDVVTLAGLDAGAAMRLAANVIGADSLPAAVAAKVLATSEGNPLFVGELVRMLVHEGALRREGDRWTTGTALAALEMPPTIHALLAARIERLHPEERLVLERASVAGRQFSRAAVLELLPSGIADLDGRLETLRRSELIERDTGWLFGEPVLRFHHVLIRDAAYRQLLKGTRAELHTRFADWALARAEGSNEHDETIGWHLEQAHQFLSELGPIDAKGRAIGERASTHLAAAGRRALDGDDVSLAASLLGRAIARLDPADEARAELALDWCEALLAAGDVGPAVAAIGELDRFVGDSDRLRAWHTCFAGQHTVLTAPEGLQTTADTVATAADTLAALGDAAGEAKAHFVHARALSSLGKIGACEAALDRALAAARRVVGDRRRANTVLAIAPLAALRGPSPVTRASGRCLDVVRVLRITQGAPAVEAVALSCQGVLEALRGRTNAARRMIASARTMVEELGITQRLLEVEVFSGQVDLLEGDAVAAERSLREAYDGLRELGLGIDAAQAAALLARALLAVDRVAEAEALSHDSEALAGDDLKAAIAWRGVRAEALARRGEHAAAVEFARTAVEIASATDALLDHADARLALAAALRAAGRGGEADAEERRAHELWEAKGATLLTERARNEGAIASTATAPIGDPRAVSRARRRRVGSNPVTASLQRFDVALAARDFAALSEFFGEAFEEIDHPTGATLGAGDALASLERLMRDRDPHFALEPLATLGESLCLCLRRVGSSGTHGGRFDVGEYASEAAHLIEADERGVWRRAEVFGSDRLDDAIVCLYERYAEGLPEGPSREHARVAANAFGCFLVANHDLERAAAVLVPDFECVDHRNLSTWSLRGAGTWIEHMRALLAVADNIEIRATAILALGPRALLIERMHTGTERTGGGAYERPFLALFVAGSDGRLVRAEWFDAEHRADAIARFEEITGAATSPRHVRPNFAASTLARMQTAISARDLEAFRALASDDSLQIDHPTGTSFPVEGSVASLARLLRGRDAYLELTAFATLGDSLVLSRRRSGASSVQTRSYDVGAFDNDAFNLMEVDEVGLVQRTEIFAADHLGDAVIRLYQRYAELLPEGEGRDRAAATAHTVGTLFGWADLETMNSIWSPAAELVDHRALGQGTMRGAEEIGEWARAFVEVEDFVVGIEDILRLQEDAALVQTMTRGTARVGGGAYERLMWSLWVFGHDGLLIRLEFFDVGHEAQAIARFDELTVAPTQAQPVDRRIAENRATAFHARFSAATLARDAATIDADLSEDFENRHHPTGASFDKRGFMRQWRSMMKAEHLERRIELLGALGESLVLGREWLGISGLKEEVLESFGPVEIHDLFVVDCDDQRLCRRIEIFAAERLGNAIARAYQLHAELQPEGVERDRCSATAHSIATFLGTPDLEAWSAAVSPAIEFVDHRVLGYQTLRGVDAYRAYLAAMFELEDFTLRIDDVLRVRPHELLVHTTTMGTARTGGGAYERPMLSLWTFGSDGLLARLEYFEVERATEAMARFDELTSVAAKTERFANAATRASALHRTAWVDKDWERFAELLPADFHISDRRRAVQLEMDREEMIAFSRSLGELSATGIVWKTLATRGERLALELRRVQASGGDVGPSEISFLTLFETDHQGAAAAIVRWDSDQRDAAYAELDARFEAGEGAAHPHVIATMRAVAGAQRDRDWDALAACCAPSCAFRDHRLLGFGAAIGDGVTRIIQLQRALAELAPDSALRDEHVRISQHGVLRRSVQHGTREGGAFENVLLSVTAMDGQARLTILDIYDVDVFDEAWARFDALGAAEPALAAHFANAATRHLSRISAAWAARDWAGIEVLFAPNMRHIDRRDLMHLELDRKQHLDSLRFNFERATSRLTYEVLATRGDRLLLGRARLDIADGAVGPNVIEFLALNETDARGDLLTLIRWNPDDLDAAYAELDARFEAGEAARYPHVIGGYRALRDSSRDRNWDAMAACLAPGFTFRDHRMLGLGAAVDDASKFVLSQQALVDLAPDAVYREDHLRTSPHFVLLSLTQHGTRDGGAFENVALSVIAVDERARIVSNDLYDVDRIDLAEARFDELRTAPSTPSPLPNAASRASERQVSLWAEKDWDRFGAAFSADFHFSDRRRTVQLELDREDAIRFFRSLGEADTTRSVQEIIATRGDRLALIEMQVEVTGDDVGPSEIVHLNLFETDEHGLVAACRRWDLDQVDEALAELDARSAALTAGEVRDPRAAIAQLNAANAASATMERLWAAYDIGFEEGDWDAMRRLSAPGIVFEDRRRMVLLTGDRELMIDSARERAAMGARRRVRRVGTAGDRVVAFHVLWSGGPSDGRFEIEYFSVSEVDEAGLLTAFVLMDPDDRRAVPREMWARWAAIDPSTSSVLAPMGEFMDAFNEQDADRLRAQFADDIVVDDHRLAGMGRIDGADAYMASIVALWELAPITRAEYGWEWPAFDHYGAITVLSRTGTVPDGGGEFESENLSLVIVTDGRITRAELFELGALDEALARFAALRPRESAATAATFANAATRTVERAASAQAVRDWDGFAATFAPGFRNFDRRSLVQLETDREQFLESHRQIIEMTSSPPGWLVLATRGEWLALVRYTWQGAEGDVGPSEIEYLLLIEVDERGDHRKVVTFDPSDLDAAYTELDACYRVAEGRMLGSATTAYRHAIERRDWDAIAAMCAPTFVEHDHRPLAVLPTTHGGEAWAGVERALIELAPDTQVRSQHVRHAAGAFLLQVIWYGTRDGSHYEIPFVVVGQLDERGRFLRNDLYDPEQLDLAFAHFEALAGSALPVPRAALVKPNLATLTTERALAAFGIADLEAAEAALVAARVHYAPDFLWEDRRPIMGLSGGLDLMIASGRERLVSGMRMESHTFVATAGDRVAVARVLWGGGPAEGRSEIEFLTLQEVNAAGLLAAVIFFDLDETRAARREAWARWAASDPIAAPYVSLLSEITDAWNDRDRAGVRARLADDIVVEDHRHAGLGRIDGADAYVESNVVLWELAPDQRIAFGGSWPAVDRHAALATLRREGALVGGGPFENDYLWLCSIAGGRVTRLELFEIDALDAALARFEQLRPDPPGTA